MPDAENAPATGAEGAVNELVTGLVAGEFLAPEGTVIDGQIGMFGAMMPEAAVHEDDEFLFGKGEVGFAEKGIMTPPAGDFMLAENLDQRDFGFLVSMAPNSRHHLGAFCFGEDVRH